MVTKNYQTQFLLVVHKKEFLNAEHVTAAKDFVSNYVLCICTFLYVSFLAVITSFT